MYGEFTRALKAAHISLGVWVLLPADHLSFEEP